MSAEHGIGSMKTEALSYSKSPVAIQIMSQLKTSFDPNGILVRDYVCVSDENIIAVQSLKMSKISIHQL